MPESIQHKLDRVRPPRVQITYDVEIGGAIEKKELPFIVGIMADLAAASTKEQLKVKDRKFVEIDRDNFNDVLKSIEPRLKIVVPNRLNGGEKLAVELAYEQLDDFEPNSVVERVPEIKDVADRRQRLSDLITKLDGNDQLEALLTALAQDEQAQSDILAWAKEAEDKAASEAAAGATADGSGAGGAAAEEEDS